MGFWIQTEMASVITGLTSPSPRVDAPTQSRCFVSLGLVENACGFYPYEANIESTKLFWHRFYATDHDLLQPHIDYQRINYTIFQSQ